MALSENGGTPGGTLGGSSDSVASVRQQLLDQLQVAWMTFGRLGVATDSKDERQALAKLRDRLSDLMNELGASDD